MTKRLSLGGLSNHIVMRGFVLLDKKVNIMQKGIWVIGDVHGEYKKLRSLLVKIPKDENICFVGDLIDKGEKSAEVVNLVIYKK